MLEATCQYALNAGNPTQMALLAFGMFAMEKSGILPTIFTLSHILYYINLIQVGLQSGDRRPHQTRGFSYRLSILQIHQPLSDAWAA